MRARFIDKDGHEEIRQVQEGCLTWIIPLPDPPAVIDPTENIWAQGRHGRPRRIRFRAKLIDGDLCYVEESRD